MKTYCIVSLCMVLASADVYATAQYPDILFVDGQQYSLHCNPLEGYLRQYPNKRPLDGVQSTALWRGYVAHFEIRNDELWVKDVQIEVWKKDSDNHDTEWLSVLDKVLTEVDARRVGWFTGFLIVPLGEMTHYVHMGYASSYERYRLLFVREGRVLASRVFTADEYGEYKRLQFEAFSKSERYRKMKKEIDDKYGSGDRYLNAENFLFIFDVSFPSEILIDYKDFKPNQALQTTRLARPEI